MSASRISLLASKTKKREESDEDEYDSEEERYRWKQQRLLKKVEESASAIRAVNEITRPFVTGTWRLEREEQRIAAAAMASTLSKENKLHSSTSSKASESLSEKHDAADQADSNRRKSIWSPIKHVKSSGVQSVLEMEKTPTWRPLRKSKARQSLALFNAENSCESVADDEDVTSSCKPLSDKDAEKTPVLKGAEEVRTPLRDVVGLNHAVGRRVSVSIPNDSVPAPPCDAGGNAMNEQLKLDNVVREDHPAERATSMTDSELSSRSSSMDDSEVLTPISQSRKFLKSMRSPVRCSPILLQAYGEEYAEVRGSIGSPDKVVNLDECSSPKDASKVLRGVTAYVEVRRGEDDRTGGFRWKLKQLGANISDTLTKKVTHVVFQEGLLSTFRKAKQIGAHLVSTHWVMACDESFSKIDEAKYPIEKLDQYEFADPLRKSIKRPKIMSPDLGSGRDDKLLTKRLQRRSMRVDSPLAKPNTFSTIKTPSPLKRINFMTRTRASPSPKKLVNEESNDDWDGFLAMVEAQVREKAESKRKTGEMNGSEEDFETKLQRLLGQDTDKAQPKLPVASIFQRGRVSSTVPTKPSPKKTKEPKKPKQTSDSTSRSSVMMNWLKSRSPEKKPNLSSMAASAAADEILKSMFKSTSRTTESKGKTPTKVVKDLKKSIKTSNISNDSKSKEPVVLTGKSESTKVVPQPGKKQPKKNKFEFQGSTACSGAMLSWLSGAKSPPLQTKQNSPLKVFKQTEESVKKRKAQEVSEIDLTCEIPDNGHGTKPTKMHRGEVTPLKQVPSKEPSRNSDKKQSVALTPRRRSLRLTPIKSTSLQSNITQLETLQESQVSSFDQYVNTTPRKQSVKCSMRETPNKRSQGSASKKMATPSKR